MVSPGCKMIADHPTGGMHDTAGVGVWLGDRVGDGVKVGSPGRCVTRTICVGKLVSVGVTVIFIAIEDRTSVVAAVKLPPMMMNEIRAAMTPVKISRPLLIAIVPQDCR